MPSARESFSTTTSLRNVHFSIETVASQEGVHKQLCMDAQFLVHGKGSSKELQTNIYDH